MEIMQYIPIMITIVGILTVVVNIIVEVLKKVTYDKIPTNLIAVVVSIALAVVTLFAVCSFANITVLWYYVAAAIIIGFFVSYAAMVGFDKFKQLFNQFVEIKDNKG